jgi:hypothetical protein
VIKNVASQSIGAEVVNATTGAAFVGAVSVYVTGDAGTQALGSVASGVCVAEGNGYFTYRPSQAETNYDLVAFTFIGTGAIPATIQVATVSAAQALALSGSGSAAISVSGLSLVTAAFELLQVFQPGASIDNAEAESARGILNRMLGQWAIQSFTIPAVARFTAALVVAKGGPSNPYTIGIGADLNTQRPPTQSHVLGAGLLLNATTPVVELPRAVYTDDQYRGVAVKELASSLFTGVWYNPTYVTGGYGTVQLYPVPNTAANSLVLYLQQALSTFPNLTSTYALPDGYEDAIVTNLARRLAKPWGATLDPDLIDQANTSLRIVKRGNMKLCDLPNYFSTGSGWYDIQTGA